MLLKSFSVTSNGRRARKSRAAAFGSIVAVTVWSPTMMFIFRDDVFGLSGSVWDAPSLSIHSETRVSA